MNTMSACVQYRVGKAMDKRIENTYTLLQNSMRDLLGSTTWDDITIQALCESAGVSRTTFYSHFKHKEDLLDSLLKMFEQAMLSDNNARSLATTKTFRFLPILLNHVNGNRKLFSKTNTETQGYPVAKRFSQLIDRLVATEVIEAHDHIALSSTAQHFVAGGIYNALVQWSANTNDDTHLTLLNDMDLLTKKLL